MRLLIITQIVDEENFILGFFHRWIEEFAKHFTEVVVIAGRVGVHHLPPNVRIYSFREGVSASSLSRLWNLWKLSATFFPKADAVLFHMAPEFVVASLPFLLWYRTRSALWYAHKSVTWKLRLAEMAVDSVFSSSQESFRLPSMKLEITGHSIDTDLFQPGKDPNPSECIIMTAGRISPVKQHEVLIEAARLLLERGTQFKLLIAGAPIYQEDSDYHSKLKKKVKDYGLEPVVEFLGPVEQDVLAKLYRKADAFVNLSATGSLDKAVLEAMAAGVPVLTSNPAFQPLLPARYYLERLDPELVAERLLAMEGELHPALNLRSIILESHDLKTNIKKISEALSSPSP